LRIFPEIHRINHRKLALVRRRIRRKTIPIGLGFTSLGSWITGSRVSDYTGFALIRATARRKPLLGPPDFSSCRRKSRRTSPPKDQVTWVQRVMGRKSRVCEVLGSPLPTETTGERPPSTVNRFSGRWSVSGSVGRSGFTRTGYGFSNRPGFLSRVAGHGLAGNRLPLLSPSGLPLSHALCLSFSLCGSLGRRTKKKKK
jgi:hypothetical protein